MKRVSEDNIEGGVRRRLPVKWISRVDEHCIRERASERERVGDTFALASPLGEILTKG